MVQVVASAEQFNTEIAKVSLPTNNDSWKQKILKDFIDKNS
jgi:hypothetical protein